MAIKPVSSGAGYDAGDADDVAETKPPAGGKSTEGATADPAGWPKNPAAVSRANPAPPAGAASSTKGAPATLTDVLSVAAAPSSRRIAGWRKPEFDLAKAAVADLLEKDPSARLESMLKGKGLPPKVSLLAADIGPDTEEIPPLPPAIQRIADSYVPGKSDIRRIDKLPPPSEIQDYVVIGSGMAGVAAGAAFEDANRAGAHLKGLVLEAGSIVGGRALDVDVNGHKAGLGPSWLHGKHNPLRRLADDLDLHRVRTFLGREVYLDGKKASDKDAEALFEEEKKAEDGMLGLIKDGKESQGNAASKFFPAGRWKEVAEAEMGRGDQGTQISKVDAIDGADFASDQDDFIQEGMQEFVTRFARAAQLPVSFNSQLKKAKQEKDGTWTLTLKDGRQVRTRQLVLTCSTAALKAIDFDPPLPQAKVDAIKDALPMGNFTKFLFTTDEDIDRPDTFKNSWVVDAETDPRTQKIHETVQFLVKYEGDPKANIMFTAAGVANDLLAKPGETSAQTEARQKKFIEEKFSKVAGHPVHVKQLAVTPFGRDPLYGGCYTSMTPGNEGAHTVFAAPWHGLNFAGEPAGTAQNNASLLAAFTSGIDSAYDVIKAIKLSPKP